MPPPSPKIHLIGQGGFGCVYYRGFNSTGNLISKKYVTKITRLEKTREISVGKTVSKLPEYETFFSTVIKAEPVNLAVVNPKVLDKCDIIKKHLDRYGDAARFQILTQAYVPNISMLDMVEAPLPSVAGCNVAKLLNTLVNCHNHLLVGLARMQNEARVVHYDIKVQNVVFNTRSKIPIIIDFGLSFSIDDVHEILSGANAAATTSDFDRLKGLATYFYLYAPDYDAWPLEVHIISYIVITTVRPQLLPRETGTETGTEPETGTGTVAVAAVITLDALTEMVDAFILNHRFISYQPEPYRARFRARAIDYYSRSTVGKPGMDVVRAYVKDWKTWDYYSVAVMFLDMIEVMRITFGDPRLAPYAAQLAAFSTSLQHDANFI
jgi:serine/threonine protein kinase